MSVFGARVEHCRREKTGGPKAGASPGYGTESLNGAVKGIGATGTLDVDVDEAWGDHPALGVERVLARAGRSNLNDDTVFNQDASTSLLGARVEQSAIGYKQSLCHLDLERIRVMDQRHNCKTLLTKLHLFSVAGETTRPRDQSTQVWDGVIAPLVERRMQPDPQVSP